MAEKRSAHAKNAWLETLARHRRPWPEWAVLERRVRARHFVEHAVGPHAFIWAPAEGDEPPLSRRITARGAPVPDVAAPFPPWMGALLGIDCGDDGDLSSAGAIADDLWPPDRLRPITTERQWCNAWHFGPLEQPIERAIHVLQRNRSGTPLFSDGVAVLAYAEETRALVHIGELETFMRFCLRHALDGEEWADAWRRGDGDAHGLQRVRYF